MNAKEMHELLDDAYNMGDLIGDSLEAMEGILISMSDEISVNYKENDASIGNLKSYYGFEVSLNALREQAIKRLEELKGKLEPVWTDTNPHKKQEGDAITRGQGK